MATLLEGQMGLIGSRDLQEQALLSLFVAAKPWREGKVMIR